MEKPAQRPEGQLLKTYLERTGISVRELGRRAKISEARVRQIINGYSSAGRGQYIDVVAPAGTLADLAQGLGIWSQELEDAGRGDAAALVAAREKAGSASGGSTTASTPDGAFIDPLEIEDDAEAMQEFLRQRQLRKGQSQGRELRRRQDEAESGTQDPGGMEPS